MAPGATERLLSSSRKRISMSPTQSAAVYGVGNAIVDIQVRVEESFLKTLDVLKGHMLLVDAARQEEILGRLASADLQRSSGGSVANSIVGIQEFGGRTAYCGRVADDEWGRFFIDEMEGLGIRVDGGEEDHGVTGTSLIAITPDAQRTMMTHLGVAAELNPNDIRPETIRGCSYAYIEGYLLAGDRTRDAALHAIDVAKDLNVKVALTVSDPFVINLARDLFWELIEGPVDLLFCNEQEAQALTGLEDPIECAREIHRHTENVALTLGENGSLLMHDGEAYPIEGVPAAEIDTTGAGDMYAAGILYGITNGLSWPAAGHLASHAAARVVSQMGARLARKFTQDEIDALTSRA